MLVTNIRRSDVNIYIWTTDVTNFCHQHVQVHFWWSCRLNWCKSHISSTTPVNISESKLVDKFLSTWYPMRSLSPLVTHQLKIEFVTEKWKAKKNRVLGLRNNFKLWLCSQEINDWIWIWHFKFFFWILE